MGKPPSWRLSDAKAAELKHTHTNVERVTSDRQAQFGRMRDGASLKRRACFASDESLQAQSVITEATRFAVS